MVIARPKQEPCARASPISIQCAFGIWPHFSKYQINQTNLELSKYILSHRMEELVAVSKIQAVSQTYQTVTLFYF